MAKFTSSLGVAARCALVASLALGCSRAAPPNVLLVVIDTLRYDHTSLAGYPRPTTPHLADVARAGAQFSTAYAPMSITLPAHATLFTGQYPITHGIVKNGLALDAQLPTLAERFAAHGYRTGAVVSSFALDSRFGLDRGFESYQDEFDVGNETMPARRWEGHDVDAGFDQRAHLTTDVALDWLGSRPRNAPFFLFVHYFDPHSPYDPPEPFRSRFGVDGPHRTEREQRIAAYDAEIAFTDDQVRRLLEAVDAETTLLIVTSDHGEGLMQHGHWHHSVDIYEESVRVPLLFRWPGHIAPGTVHPEPVEMVDLLPTLLELAQIPNSDSLPGRSLAPALLGEAELDATRSVYLQRRFYRDASVGEVTMKGGQFGIRSGSWKFIVGPRENRTELYDLRRDPGEQSNLIAKHRERGLALADALRQWRDTHWVEPGGQQDLDPQVRRGLEALGYVE